MENDLRIAYASEIITRLGGTGAVADLFEIDAAAVSQWRRNGIPKARMQFISVARPDVLVGLGAQTGCDVEGMRRPPLQDRARARPRARRIPDA